MQGHRNLPSLSNTASPSPKEKHYGGVGGMLSCGWRFVPEPTESMKSSARVGDEDDGVKTPH
ncbi:hypothetical protein BDV33DRAFT_178121 [Aspergillus novoparasiticus]|uniref:Uncharacterized protein n=1 Tax=Aspergillus novoparasiticus TaxID=986946 RepID=A0A5N6EII9_9EURO|nr:hypothetical protein BDV33DRAFT_178121 [Aspergillus novoparasiticus]